LEPVSITKTSCSRPQFAHFTDRIPLAFCGLLAIAFFATHAAAHVARGTTENAIWVCHFSSLLIGIGLLSRSATLNAIGLLILIVGVPLWLVNLATGGEFLATSLLTHVGGLSVAVFGAQRLGLPRRVWFKALITATALIMASIWWTPPGANVNLAFHGPPIVGMMSVHPSIYLIGLLLFWGISLWSAERLVARWLHRRGCRST
jgi:hypothetical protein